MEASNACRIINDDIVFQPDWKITAEENTKRFENGVKIHIEFFAYDSSREHFERGNVHLYPVNIRVDFSMQVDECRTPEDVMFKLFEIIMKVYEHETREFLRLKSARHAAPFHPHKPATMMEYHDRMGTGAHGMVHDLIYGIG
jgi:hypothetical protein